MLTPPTDPPPASDRAPRVLVVDDNADTCGLVTELLSSWGCIARPALHGRAALAIAAEFLPEVVLLDIGLPDLDGYEVARRLCQTAPLGKMRLVAMTGYRQPGDRERARDAGFHEHIVKPLDLDRLRRVVMDGPDARRMWAPRA